MMWQPISTAPMDGTVIDLWMVNERGEGWRVTDAYYVRDYPTGGYGERRGRRDGWFAANHDYEGQDGWCDVPRAFNSHPRVMAEYFKLPTHWMQIPPPPTPQEE